MNTPTIPQHHKRRLQAHFALTRLPFRKSVPAAQMFDSKAQRELHHGLQMWTEVSGFALVAGPSGVGKSITLRRFVTELDEARFRLLHFTSLPTTIVGFLRSLSRMLGLPLRLHAADMFDAARNHLLHYADEHGPQPLLVLDDAEGLRLDTLDMLRRLATSELDAEDRFSVLLAGTEELLDKLRHPDIEPLRTRISYIQTLRSFSLEDTRNYIAFQLRFADANADLISDDAVRRLFNAAKGRPRLINQLALQALIGAAVCGMDSVTGDFMAEQINAHPLYQVRPDAQA